MPQVYRSCREAIERFVTEHLEMGKIDENLAVLYERYLDKQVLNRPPGGTAGKTAVHF